jgi:hypothetical protein
MSLQAVLENFFHKLKQQACICSPEKALITMKVNINMCGIVHDITVTLTVHDKEVSEWVYQN